MRIRKFSHLTRGCAVFVALVFLGSITCFDAYSQMEAAPVNITGEVAIIKEKIKHRLPKPGNITVNFKDVDIKTVLHYLSEVSGVDIIPAPGVETKVTMRLRDKPWEVALDIVTRNYGFVYSREGGIIRVIPKGQLHTEEPVTVVIPLNNLIREIELSKQDSSDIILVEEKQESIMQLMRAIDSMLDSGRGERATYISSVNAIVITAIPARISNIKDMVAIIDKKTAQIVLDAMIIEIILNKDERFGVDWRAIISAAGAKRPTTFPFSNTGIIPGLGNGDQANFYPTNTTPLGGTDFPFLLNSGVNPLTLNPTAAALFTYGTLDFSTFSATLSLLQQRGDTEVLSSPRITTLDNQKATIKVVDKIMLQKTQETTQTAGIVTVEFEKESEAREVGVKMTVIPHVNADGEISVNLLPEVSTNAGFSVVQVGGIGALNTVALTFSSREANTIVRVRDGETIFLGGLIKKSIIKTDNKFPILGDLLGGIPVIGNIFKYEAERVERSEIVFFITVHIVDDGKESIEKTRTVAHFNKYLPWEEPILPQRPPQIMSGILDVKEETVEIEVPVIEATEPKKGNKPFMDFRKKE